MRTASANLGAVALPNPIETQPAAVCFKVLANLCLSLKCRVIKRRLHHCRDSVRNHGGVLTLIAFR